MIQEQKKQEIINQRPNPSSIGNLFHFGLFSAVQEGSYLRLIYIFINNISVEDPITAGLVMPTNILCDSILEAAFHMNQLVSVGVFQQTTLNLGIVYDENYQKINEVDWNILLKDYYKDIGEECDQRTIH